MDEQKRIDTLKRTHAYLTKKLGKLYRTFPIDNVPLTLERQGFVNYGSFSAKIDKNKAELKSSIEDIESQIKQLEDQIGA